MKKILFVCTGNTCRSSMAEAIFNHLVENHPELSKEYRAFSAGIAAIDGDSASSHSVTVLKDLWKIDLSGHSAKKVQLEHIRDAFLILTMTRSHKQTILSMFPEAAGKTYTLKEFVSPISPDQDGYGYHCLLDIPDPFGMPEEVYRQCALEMYEALEELINKLQKGQA